MGLSGVCSKQYRLHSFQPPRLLVEHRPIVRQRDLDQRLAPCVIAPVMHPDMAARPDGQERLASLPLASAMAAKRKAWSGEERLGPQRIRWPGQAQHAAPTPRIAPATD